MASVGVAQPAAKAAERRTRVAVFGGSTNKQVGRRNQAGKVFNRRNKANNGPVQKAGFYGKDGADLGLNEGVTPEGNLWNTWTPDMNIYTDKPTGPMAASDSDPNAPYGQVGTLSSGARGFYSPTTGKFIFYDYGDPNSGE